MPEVAENQLIDGRYRVLYRIGSGGMADVWSAEDTHLQRRVALKVLHNRFAQDQEFVERFRREAEAAAGLQHPNVVGVFDRGAVNGTYYIAMEYLEGRSLKELIDVGMSSAEAVALTRQVLEAARFAHRHGVIHRDLKPQNVIVNAEGKATVTDFGIARAGASEITQTGSVMGTAHYLSPEQAQGLEVTAASDLYSIGVMLYEALTGSVPFQGESAVAVALKQVSQPPRRPSSVNPSVSPALDAVVMRALEKDPMRRFRDADAFIAALDAAERDPGTPRAGETAAFAAVPVEAPPEAAAAAPADGEAARARRRKRRRRLLLVAAAVLIGAGVGLALTQTPTTNVPNVTNPFGTNQSLSTAITQLSSAGFRVAAVRRVNRPLPRDTVIEQDPPPGSADLSCSLLIFACHKPAVTLTVSAGPGVSEVPDVSGLPQASAEQKLRAAGFAVAIQNQSSDTVAQGNVIGTDPPANTSLQRGKLVTLTVSSGQRLVSVPLLIGRQRVVAVALLRSAGLSPNVTQQPSNAPQGEVQDQSPSAGTKVKQGSSVTLVVSSGAQKVSVPDVGGRPRSAAVSTLRSQGFSVAVQQQTTSDPSQNGRVIRQSPGAGSQADQGSTVTIIVGQAQPSSPTG